MMNTVLEELNTRRLRDQGCVVSPSFEASRLALAGIVARTPRRAQRTARVGAEMALKISPSGSGHDIYSGHVARGMNAERIGVNYKAVNSIGSKSKPIEGPTKSIRAKRIGKRDKG